MNKTRKYYRYVTASGRGTWDEGKEKLPENLISDIISAKSWCPKTPRFEHDCITYFTEKGNQMYKKTLLPLHSKYLQGIQKLEIENLEQKDLLYEDDFQIVIKIKK